MILCLWHVIVTGHAWGGKSIRVLRSPNIVVKTTTKNYTFLLDKHLPILLQYILQLTQCSKAAKLPGNGNPFDHSWLISKTTVHQGFYCTCMIYFAIHLTFMYWHNLSCHPFKPSYTDKIYLANHPNPSILTCSILPPIQTLTYWYDLSCHPSKPSYTDTIYFAIHPNPQILTQSIPLSIQTLKYWCNLFCYPSKPSYTDTIYFDIHPNPHILIWSILPPIQTQIYWHNEACHRSKPSYTDLPPIQTLIYWHDLSCHPSKPSYTDTIYQSVIYWHDLHSLHCLVLVRFAVQSMAGVKHLIHVECLLKHHRTRIHTVLGRHN